MKSQNLIRIFVLLIFFCFKFSSAYATHFRYGSISWKKLNATDVEFKVSLAYRSGFFGNPPLGGSISPETFNFGDGNSIAMTALVTSVNATEGWFYSESIFTHTYSANGNFVAYILSGDRISTLSNNPDGGYRVQTIVNITAPTIGNSSPVTTLPPIITLQAGLSNATFNLTASDPNGDPLTYRLATFDESSNTVPPGLTISSAGLVTFNTVGMSNDQLWTASAIVSDGVSEVPLDFIIRISNTSSVPPIFDYTVTPGNNATLNASVGLPLSFSIKATDSDAGDVVNLSVVGQPISATFAPVLPASGNPAMTTFMWTPTAADAGANIVLSITATDQSGAAVLTSVTIEVTGAVCTGTADVITSPICQGSNINLTASGGASYKWAGPNGFSSTAQNPEITNATPAMSGTYTVEITCANGLKDTKTVNVQVDATSVGGTVIPGLEFCGNQQIVLTLSGHVGTIIQWDVATTLSNNGVTTTPPNRLVSSGNVNPLVTTTPNDHDAGIYRYCAYVQNGVCPVVKSTQNTVRVDRTAKGGKVVKQGTNQTSQTICSSQNTVLELKNFRGRVVKWQKTYATSPVWVDIPNSAGSTTLNVAGSSITQTTYCRAVICAEFGICAPNGYTAYSASFKISKSSLCPTNDGSSIAINNANLPILAKLYPTPVKDVLNIEIDSPQEQAVMLNVMDITGKIVHTEKQTLQANANLIEMAVADMSAGMYMLLIENNKGERSSYKFLKTR
jgi:hypothetical protein